MVATLSLSVNTRLGVRLDGGLPVVTLVDRVVLVSIVVQVLLAR